MILTYNLQFFAKEGMGGEKTEPATPKKLEDARKEGQVAKSREIGNAFGILALFLVLKFMIGWIAGNLLSFFGTVYNKMPDVVTFWHGFMPINDLGILFRQMLFQVLLIIAPILMIGFLIAFLCDLVQVKWKPTGKTLKPKFSKLNPINGFKRIFSVNSLVELVKSVLKIMIVSLVCYSYLKDKLALLYSLYDMSLMQSIQLIGETITDLGIRIAAVYMLLAFSDFAYQKYKFSNDMKMTKQEIKEEYKQSEGDPQIKGKIRQKMQQASQRRMMQNIPKADVVITNPTHYAVAIQYDTSVADAPVVLAKGADYVAAKIKDVAKENGVEIVENKPLARMLYANVEIGQAVPPELYQAVAEVLAFVYQLQGKI